MKISRILAGLFALVASVALFAQEPPAQTQTNAKLKAVAGSVTVTMPDGSVVPASVGMALPQGAVVNTAANSQAQVEVHDGIVAILGQSTSAGLEKLSINAKGVRTGLVDLKSGTIATSLDPKRKSVNNYAVKTPKGVAAARGTVYSVNYQGAIYSVTVVAGVVSALTVQQYDTWTQVAANTYANDGRNIVAGQMIVDDAGGASAGSRTSIEEAVEMGLAGNDPGSNGVSQRAAVSSQQASEGLALLAAAVAANPSSTLADVKAVITTIAQSVGTSENAQKAVAMAAASAAATAATNSSLNGGTTGTASTASATDTAKAIVEAAVAVMPDAAGKIVSTTAVAVAAVTNTTKTDAASAAGTLATTLATTANQSLGDGQKLDAAATGTATAAVVTNSTNLALGNAATTTVNVADTVITSDKTTTTPTTVVTPPTVIDSAERSGS